MQATITIQFKQWMLSYEKSLMISIQRLWVFDHLKIKAHSHQNLKHIEEFEFFELPE